MFRVRYFTIALALLALFSYARADTILQLDQWKSTTTPFNATTPNVAGKDIYAPFSNATTSLINTASTTASSTFAGGLNLGGSLRLDKTLNCTGSLQTNILGFITCGAGGSGITSLNGLNGSSQTFSVSNPLIGAETLNISSSGTTHLFTVIASSTPSFASITATSTTISSVFPLANITKLSNLPTNGFVKTSSNDGTLTVDTNTYLTSLAGAASSTLLSDVNTFSGASTTFNQKVNVGGTLTAQNFTLYGTITLPATSIANAALQNGGGITVTTASPLGGAATVKPGDTLALTCTGCLTSAITSLNGLSGASQTFKANSLLTISSSGTAHSFEASSSPAFNFITATSTSYLSEFYGNVQIDSGATTTSLYASASSTVATRLNVGDLLQTYRFNASSTATSTFGGGISVGTQGLLLPASGFTSCGSLGTNANGYVTCAQANSGTITSGTTNRLAYYSGATTLNSANFLTISASGLGTFGVGTSSPSGAFAVYGQDAAFDVRHLSIGTSTPATSTLMIDYINSATSTIPANINAFVIGTSTVTTAQNFATAGIFTIDGLNGRVGISTSTPGTALAVRGSADIFQVLNVDGNLAVRGSATSTIANGFVIDNGTLNVDTVGNLVGIGTTSPGQTLSVNGAGILTQLNATGVTIINSGLLTLGSFQASSTAATSSIAWGLKVATNGGLLLVGTTTGLANFTYGSSVAGNEYRFACSGASVTINWNNGPKQTCIASVNVTSISLTGGNVGTTYQWDFCQDNSGGRGLAGWPGNVMFMTSVLGTATNTPGIATKAGVCTRFSFTSTSATGTLQYESSLPILGH